MLPGDALPLVLLLLLLQHQLDEQLLQLLIAVVDAELLEAVRDEIDQVQRRDTRTVASEACHSAYLLLSKISKP